MVQAEGLEQQVQVPLGVLSREAGVADEEGDGESRRWMDLVEPSRSW